MSQSSASGGQSIGASASASVLPVNIQTDAEAETPIFWPPDAKNWLTGKDLMLGKIEGRRRRRRQRMRWLGTMIDSVDMNLSKLQEIVEDRGA